jgi:hypothetical protein
MRHYRRWLGVLSSLVAGASAAALALRAPLEARAESRNLTAQRGASVAPVRYPMRDWMKANATPAMAAGDAPALSRVFARIETLALPAFLEWKTLARAGLRSAEGGELEECRVVCKRCHDSYRAQMRERPLP